MLENITTLDNLDKAKLVELVSDLQVKITTHSEELSTLRSEMIESEKKYEREIGELTGKLASEQSLRDFIRTQSEQTISDLRKEIERHRSIEDRSMNTMMSAVLALSGNKDLTPPSTRSTTPSSSNRPTNPTF